MINFLALLAVVYFLTVLFRIFRRALPGTDNPVFVMEKPPMSRQLTHVSERADRWRAEGRLSREEHQNLIHLIEEDAARERASAAGRPKRA